MRQEIWIMKSFELWNENTPMYFLCISMYWRALVPSTGTSLMISSDIWWLTFLLRICSINSTVLPKARSEHSKVHCKKSKDSYYRPRNTMISKNLGNGPHQSKIFKTRKYKFVSAVAVYQSNKWSYMLVLEFMSEMTQLLV